MKMSESLWERSHVVHRVLDRRASGELPPMDASEFLANIVSQDYLVGETVLDVGCGPGHFYRSFSSFLPEECYSGSDLSSKMIGVARNHFPKAGFHVLPLEDMSSLKSEFDHVICSNVLPHVDALWPALESLIKVTRKRLYIRALFGDQTFLIRHIHNSENYAGVSEIPITAEINRKNEPVDFHHFNIYSKKLVAHIAYSLGASKVSMFDDTFIDHGRILKEQNKSKNATQSLGGHLVIGNIICPWGYAIIDMGDKH